MANSTRMKWPYPSEGADPWYESFDSMVKAIDSSVYGGKEFANLIVTGGGNFTWNASTNILSWTAPFRVYSGQTGFYEEVAAGSASVPTDGALGYVLFNSQPLNNTTLTLAVDSQLPYNEPDRSLLIFRRRGNRVYFRNGFVVQDGETIQVFEGGAVLILTLDGDVTGSSSANTVVALRNVPLSMTALAVGEAYVFDGTELAPTLIPTINSFWSLTGNAGTVPKSASGVAYVGTSDSVALDLATNATVRLTIGADGSISAPLASGATLTVGGTGAGAISFGATGSSDLTFGNVTGGGDVSISAGPTKTITLGSSSAGGNLALYAQAGKTITVGGTFNLNAGTAAATTIGNTTNGQAVSIYSAAGYEIVLKTAQVVRTNAGTSVEINTSAIVGEAGNTNIGVSGKTVTLYGTYVLASLTAPAATKYSPLRIDSNRQVSNSALNLSQATEITGWDAVSVSTAISLTSTDNISITSAVGKTITVGTLAAAATVLQGNTISIQSTSTIDVGTTSATTITIGRAGATPTTTVINGNLTLGSPLPISQGGTGAATTTERFVFIGPNSTTAPPAIGAPSFRALVADDLPTVPASKVTSIPYDFSGEVPGLPGTNVELYHFKAVRAFRLAAAVSATDVHQAGCLSAPSATTTFNIYKNSILNTAIGTFTINTSKVATFTVTQTDFAKGDLVIVTTTSSVNGIIQPFFTFTGTLL